MNNTTTARLRFRDINSGDLQNLISLYGCAETMKYITNGKTLNYQQNESKLAELLGEKDKIHPLGVWAGEQIQTKEFVGWFLVKNFPEIDCPGIGYSLIKKFRGQGYATEGAQALVDYAFKHIQLKKISATTDPRNETSIHILKKIGFKFEKVIPYTHPLLTEPAESNLFYMTDEDYKKP